MMSVLDWKWSGSQPHSALVSSVIGQSQTVRDNHKQFPLHSIMGVVQYF